VPLQKRPATSAELRQLFNTQIEHRILSGEYRLNPVTRHPPSEAIRAKAPPGIESVYYEVLNQQGRVMATAHAYELPDKTYWASGRLDPKKVLIGNTLYFLKKE
jgi:hypothetical protein